MQHLDEGTIHAWLDGQLPQDEAQQVEAHVAECRQCADAVAEARGLIAASSRILTALDSVPGEVVPKQAPFRTEAETARANAIADAAADAIVPLDLVVQRRPRRWFNGASLAAAAAIVVGVGTVVLMQRSGRPVPAAMERTVSSTAAAGRSADSVASAAPVPSAAPAPPAQSLGNARAVVSPPNRALADRDAANEARRPTPSGGAAEQKKAEAGRTMAAVATPLSETSPSALNRAKEVAANKPADELAKDTKQRAQSVQQQPSPRTLAPQRREAVDAMQAMKVDSARLDQAQVSAVIAGAPMGGLKGRVTDANNNGLSGVAVAVDGTATGAVTNSAGEFAISSLQVGVHRISVRRVGYQPVNRDVTVTPGRPVQTDVVLNATQTTLSEAVVTGTSAAAPRAAAGARAKTAAAPTPAVDTPPGAPITAEQSNAVGCYDLGITPLSATRNSGFRQVPRRVALDSEIVPANADGVWYRARDLARTSPLANGLWRPTGTDAIELEFTYGSRTARVRVSGPPGAMMRGSLEEIDRATATGEAGNVVAVRRSCEP